MKLSDIAKKMILILIAALLLLIGAGVVYYRSPAVLPFAFGAGLGVGLNILKVIMLDRTVKKAADMEKEKAGNYLRIQHFLRFLLTGIILVLSALVWFINIYGAAAGVLTFQIALLFAKCFTGSEEDIKKDTNT